MQFFMGLNEAYTHARDQVLLMEPIPTISKVYTMLTQEETQRSIGLDSTPSSDLSNSLAMAIGDDQKKFKEKERPLCTHWKMLGHTVDKCYKIHGYPQVTSLSPRIRRILWKDQVLALVEKVLALMPTRRVVVVAYMHLM